MFKLDFPYTYRQADVHLLSKISKTGFLMMGFVYTLCIIHVLYSAIGFI